MDFTRLNPVVRDAAIYEKVAKASPARAYDSRIIYMISGGLTVTVGKEKIKLSPGNLCFIPAGVEYRLKAQYMRAAIVCFDLTDENPLPEERMPAASPEEFDEGLCHATPGAPFDKLIFVEDMESDREVFTKMCELFVAKEGFFRAYASAMLKTVLLKLAENADEHALPSRMIESLGEYIRENSHDDISNTEIGAIFGYHPFYISRMLKERRGVTMRQYIISYRMKSAESMLRLTTKSVAEIAEENGFSDASYFTKSFKQAFGMTPKEYRAKFEDELI